MPLNPFQRGAALVYLDAKAAWSLANDRLLVGVPRRPVPKFDNPAAAALYYFRDHGNPYTGDPMHGAGDFYTAPERVQAALENPEQLKHTFIDCDDVAGWYLRCVQQMPGYKARIVTLIDPVISAHNGSHVICTYEGPHGCGALDTNGHRPLPDLSEATLCRVWSGLYASLGYVYAGALDSPYPFT